MISSQCKPRDKVRKISRLLLIAFSSFWDRSQHCTRATCLAQDHQSSTAVRRYDRPCSQLQSTPYDCIWTHFSNVTWLVLNLASRPLHLLHLNKCHSIFVFPLVHNKSSLLYKASRNETPLKITYSMLAVKLSFPRHQTKRTSLLVQNLGYFFFTKYACEILFFSESRKWPYFLRIGFNVLAAEREDALCLFAIV
jgi:hypothetical protein